METDLNSKRGGTLQIHWFRNTDLVYVPAAYIRGLNIPLDPFVVSLSVRS